MENKSETKVKAGNKGKARPVVVTDTRPMDVRLDEAVTEVMTLFSVPVTAEDRASIDVSTVFGRVVEVIRKAGVDGYRYTATMFYDVFYAKGIITARKDLFITKLTARILAHPEGIHEEAYEKIASRSKKGRNAAKMPRPRWTDTSITEDNNADILRAANEELTEELERKGKQMEILATQVEERDKHIKELEGKLAQAQTTTNTRTQSHSITDSVPPPISSTQKTPVKPIIPGQNGVGQ